MEVDTGRLSLSRLWPVTHHYMFEEHQTIVGYVKAELAKVQERQKQFYDQCLLYVQFQVSDCIYVRAKLVIKRMGKPDYSPTKGPTKRKLLSRWVEPFQIASCVGEHTYRLALFSNNVYNADH